jgi:hypothetical protein
MGDDQESKINSNSFAIYRGNEQIETLSWTETFGTECQVKSRGELRETPKGAGTEEETRRIEGEDSKREENKGIVRKVFGGRIGFVD